MSEQARSLQKREEVEGEGGVHYLRMGPSIKDVLKSLTFYDPLALALFVRISRYISAGTVHQQNFEIFSTLLPPQCGRPL